MVNERIFHVRISEEDYRAFVEKCRQIHIGPSDMLRNMIHRFGLTQESINTLISYHELQIRLYREYEDKDPKKIASNQKEEHVDVLTRSLRPLTTELAKNIKEYSKLDEDEKKVVVLQNIELIRKKITSLVSKDELKKSLLMLNNWFLYLDDEKLQALHEDLCKTY